MPKNFAITGVGGYIATRHLQAIKTTGNHLIAAVDPNDSVGVLDKYFFDTSFFKEFERFDRHLEKLRYQKSDKSVDYVSICSPNYLHDAHIRFALRIGAHAICEKPLVLNPWNVDLLQELALEHQRNIYTVLQLRLHPAIIALKKKIDLDVSDKKYLIDLTYITSRGKWYLVSWKGDLERSGGLATNIGIHFFDMLVWIFGESEQSDVHFASPTKIGGVLHLKRATVTWFLSIENTDIPADIKAKGQATFRSLTMDGKEIEFSEGFTDLHTRVYEDILSGGGFGPEDARKSIVLAHQIRNATPTGICEYSHPLLKKNGS
jgi:UDP-N-acetyl-2-amino-2-deoxyglucuronate dehydrogenase